MLIKERFDNIIAYFEQNMPKPETELHYSTAYELVVAVILSTQCTDKRVNIITPFFFAKFPSPIELANANQEDVYNVIKTCSYPNNKGKNLIAMAQCLIKDFNGEYPDNVEDLQKLPGIGRKSANVIASVVFNKQALAVDTHVFRVAARLGLTKEAKNPLQTETQLIRHIPYNKLSDAHHWLILHGRYVCKARKPLCNECNLKVWCKFFIENNKKTLL